MPSQPMDQDGHAEPHPTVSASASPSPRAHQPNLPPASPSPFNSSPIDPDPLSTYADAFLVRIADGSHLKLNNQLSPEQCDVVDHWANAFVLMYFVPRDDRSNGTSTSTQEDALGRLVDRINTHLLHPTLALNAPIQSKLNGQHVELNPQASTLLDTAFALLRDFRDFDHRSALDKLLKIFVDRLTSPAVEDTTAKELAEYLIRLVAACHPHDRRLAASTLGGYIIRSIRHRTFLHHEAFHVLSEQMDFLASLGKEEVTPSVSGRGSLDSCLDHLFDCAPWNQKHMVPIIDMCKDMNLSQDQLKRLVDVIVKKHLPSPEMDLVDVPILIFNLLTVTGKLKSSADKRAVFGDIATYMATTAEAASSSPEPERARRMAEQSTMEATTLMHFRHALNGDSTMPQDFSAYAMGLKRQGLTPYNIMAILMWCESKPNHPLLHHIRKELEALVKIESESQRLKWLQGFSPFEIPSPKTILQTVVQHTSHNWQVLQPLIQLGCLLVDRHDPKHASSSGTLTSSPPATAKLQFDIPGLSFSATDGALGQLPVAPRTAPGQPAADPLPTISALGQDLLFDLYTQHALVRGAILDRIRTQLATDAPTAGHYLTLLAGRVLASPDLAMDLVANHGPHVRQLLDVLATRAGGVLAMRLLAALVPLIRWDPALREAILLLVRKALAHKSEQVRDMAVVGCVRLLDVVSAPEAGFTRRFRLEVVGLTRGVAALSAGSKVLYYQQLMAAMAAKDGAHLAALVVLSLHERLDAVMDRANGCLIRFSQCVDGVEVMEPVHWLIKCATVAVTQCAKYPSEGLEGAEKTAWEEAQRTLVAVKKDVRQCAEKMRAMDLSDYGIPATAPFSFNEQVHAEMYVLANLITATYETVLEFIAATRKPSTGTGSVPTVGAGAMVRASGSGPGGDDQLLEALYNRGRESMDAIRTRFLDAKGKKKPSQPLHCDACLIDPATLYALQETLNMPDRQLMAKLSSAVHLSSEAQHHLLVDLGRVFLAQLLPANIAAVANRTKDQKAKGEQSLAMFAIESLEAVIRRVLMHGDYAERLAAMARNDRARGGGAVDEGLSLVQLISQRIEALIDAEYVAEAAKLIGVLDLLLPWLSADHAQVVGDCVVELLMGGTTLADYKVLRELVALLIRVAWDNTDDLEFKLNLVALHVLHHLGQLQATSSTLINEYAPHPIPSDLAESDQFNVDLRDAKNQQWLVKVVIQFVGEILAELDWAFKEYKVEFGKKGSAPSLERRAAFENRVAARLHAALVPVHTISVIASPYELAETLNRSLIHTFNTTTTYLQLKRSMDTRPDDHCVQVIRRASALRHWMIQLSIHFDKAAIGAAAMAKEKEEAKKAKAAGKGKGKGKAGAAGKGKGKAKPVDSDDDDDELMDEDEEQRSVTSGTGTAMTGATHMTPEQRAHAKLVKRQRAVGKLAAEVVGVGESFDAQIIALANVYKSLNKFVRRSAVHDVKLPTKRPRLDG